MLHERIRRHVGYVLITHTFPLEGGVILRHALKRSVPVIILVIYVVKFISYMCMPQCILKIVKLIKISVLHSPESKYPRSTLSNFLTHFSVDHTVITQARVVRSSFFKVLIVRQTSNSVCDCSVILVGSVIRHWKLLTSSRSSRIFPSALPSLSLSIFKSPAMTTVCLNKQLPTSRNNMQQGVQTCNIQQYWELLANNVASVCTGLKLSAKSLNGYVLLNKVWFSGS